MPPDTSAPRGRWAPSPTGELHVGNARTALVSWWSVRARGGSYVYRIEDLDGPRVVPGLDERQQEDLLWLGIDWDEGPRPASQDPHEPYRQSERTALYLAALRRLDEQGLVFPCGLSRRELSEIASAPHGPETSPYPVRLRPRDLEPGWLGRLLADEDQDGPSATTPTEAVRFRVEPGQVAFDDLVLGQVRQDVHHEVGDFVLRRRDGVWAYQLAVVVDDLEMEIDEVIRGEDLVSSTGRQILLFEALAPSRVTATPRFGHVPLMVTENGDKLSKRDGSLTLGHLRERGVAPERLVGYLAWTLGLVERPGACSTGELTERFHWGSIREHREPTPVAPDLAERLLDDSDSPGRSSH